MITFVALVVGATIIQFSRSIVIDSRDKLTELGKDEDELKDKILELGTGSNTEYASLAEACYDMGFGKSPGEFTCFVVKATNTPSKAGITPTYAYDPADLTVTVSGGSKTFFFIYEPQGKVRIED